MRQMLVYLFILFTMLSLYSQTTYIVGDSFIHPSIDFDFGNIQSAINYSVNGDTIVVYPGRYQGTQVNFNGKNVYITSCYKYTEDRNDIYNTIIDRQNNTGSAVVFTNNESRNAVLNGFTIENGIGESTNPSSPQLREGGGIFIRDASPTILNCVVKNNSASQGGGVSVISTGVLVSPYLAGNVIKNNNSIIRAGGGIRIAGTSNQHQMQVIFDTNNKNSIFMNNAHEHKDIYSFSPSYMSVVLDTFTVATDDPYYIGMLGSYDFSCDHWVIEQIDQDLYVSVLGSDTNSGLSFNTPLNSINEAMHRIKSNPDNRNTIHIAPGVYKASEGQIFPIKIKSDVILQGAGQDVTIFDLERNTGAIHSGAGAKGFKISRIAFINSWGSHYDGTAPIFLNGTDDCEISDCHFANNLYGIKTEDADGYAHRTQLVYFKNISFLYNYNHAIDVNLENAIFENIKILENRYETFGHSQSNYGTPLRIESSHDVMATYKLSNILIANTSDFGAVYNPIYDHSQDFGPLAIWIGDNMDVVINSATIVNNQLLDIDKIHPLYFPPYFMCIGHNSDVKTYNSIFYNNMDNYIVGAWQGTSTFELFYSLLSGGPSQVLECNLVWGDGNIDEYPGFDWGYPGILDWPYQLRYDSPCIDTGTTNIPSYTWLPVDLLGNTRIIGDTVDMGAYEFNGDNNFLVDFEGSPRTGIVPLSVQFTDTSVGYEITSWQWDFQNDGVIDSTEQNPTFTYYTTGQTTVRLVINNGQASRVKPEYINPRPEDIISGTLQGLVTSNGAPLVNVLVTVTGTSHNASTNEWGVYTIPNIPQGVYSITATLTDYQTYTHDNIVIMANQVTTHNITLSPVSESDIVMTLLHTQLKGNYPNPFNPETTIYFDMALAGLIQIEVFNIKGSKVKNLLNGYIGSGGYQIVWDGHDDLGRPVSSGVYFYRLITRDHKAVRKMLLLK